MLRLDGKSNPTILKWLLDCVVPGTRGVEQSRPREAIVAEVAALVSEGFQEVTLLGQNIDAWGRDMEPKQLFADLLAAVAKVQGLSRVRFVTSHPVRPALCCSSSALPLKHALPSDLLPALSR